MREIRHARYYLVYYYVVHGAAVAALTRMVHTQHELRVGGLYRHIRYGGGRREARYNEEY